MSTNLRKQNSGGWQIETLRTLDEIEAIRPIWEQMQANEPRPSVNTDVDRYLSVVECDEGISQPVVILLKKHGEPEALVAGRLGKMPIPVRIGYKAVASPTLRSLAVTYGGVLGQPDEVAIVQIIRGLAGFLNRKEADIVFFNHLDIDSVFYQQVRKASGFWRGNHFLTVEPHWRMAIPLSLSEFFQSLSGKHRRNLRRAVRKLEEEYGEEFQIVHYQNVDDIPVLSRDVESISVKTYQHALNAGFSCTPLTQSILTRDATRGRLLMSVLYIQGRPCAFQWGTVLRNTYFMEKVGYDPEWSRFRVGNVLFIQVLESLCHRADLEFLDFGFGDAEYKRSYGNKCWQEAAQTYVFAPRLYPVMLNMFQSSVMGLSYTLRRGLNAAGLTHRVKRLWRGKLQESQSQSSEKT